MFESSVENVAASSRAKVDCLKLNPLGYSVASLMAGLFISLGGFIALSAGGYSAPLLGTSAKLVSAISFAAALSLVVMAGSELFTGNNMVVGLGALLRRITWRDCLLLWGVCWLGNLVGSWLGVVLFHLSGADAPQLVAKSFAAAAAAKCAYGTVQLLFRGVLCNLLVCLAVWCAAKMKDETAKLIMIFWCIFIFMVCGFEHSIANMSIIGVALLNPSAAGVTFAGYCHNLLCVTLGNVFGGFALVSVPYVLMARRGACDAGKVPG